MNIHSMSSHTCIYIHICVKGCREGRRVRERPKKDAMDTTARASTFPIEVRRAFPEALPSLGSCRCCVLSSLRCTTALMA